MKKGTFNNIPDSMSLWAGLGNSFDTISQVLCEFIDNSISNFEKHNNLRGTIIIEIIEVKKNTIEISIEDNGSGINELENVFTIGTQKNKDSTRNEHGFGFKHALAAADPENKSWEVITKLSNDNFIYKVKAPYLMKNQKFVTEMADKWKRNIVGYESGSCFKFKTSFEMLKTVTKGRPGDHGFRSSINCIIEDLGFIYSSLIYDAGYDIIIHSQQLGENVNKEKVKPLEPDWQTYKGKGNGEEKGVILDGSSVDIKYKFGVIKDNSKYKKYYRPSMRSSGVEIRFNGRVICNNIFSEIWDIEKNNIYNRFLVIIDLKSKDAKSFPKTRTQKNGIKEDDKKLSDLYVWIKRSCPDPYKNAKSGKDEVDLFKILAKEKETHLKDFNPVVKTEFPVFKKLKDSVRIDLYLFYDDKLTIYEGKKDKTSVQDVFQLMMYWNGCIIDGIGVPNIAYLIAKEHPQGVIDMIKKVNTRFKDMNDKPYKIEHRFWKDEGQAFEDLE